MRYDPCPVGMILSGTGTLGKFGSAQVSKDLVLMKENGRRAIYCSREPAVRTGKLTDLTLYTKKSQIEIIQVRVFVRLTAM